MSAVAASQQLTADLAVGWPVSRWLTPFLEAQYGEQDSGQETKTRSSSDGRHASYILTRSFNVRPLPGANLAWSRAAISGAENSTMRIHAGLVWKF